METFGVESVTARLNPQETPKCVPAAVLYARFFAPYHRRCASSGVLGAEHPLWPMR